MLVLCSDGATAATSADEEEFGRYGIERTLHGVARNCPSTVATAIADALELHTGGARQDHMKLMVIGRT